MSTADKVLKKIQADYKLSNGVVAEICSVSAESVTRWRSGARTMPDSALRLLGYWLTYDYPQLSAPVASTPSLNNFFAQLESV